MKKRYVILGVGNFGKSWARHILPESSEFAELAGVCDSNPAARESIGTQTPFFTDIDAAISTVRPDGIINVTPPGKHTALNMHILSQGIPVLCEKPISETYDDALRMMDFVRDERNSNACLMISENYRYNAAMRKARELIASKEFGELRSLSLFFRQYHPDASDRSHGRLAHPLLIDVAVHHLDVARYLSGEEPVSVLAHGWGAPHTWYGERIASVIMHTGMTNGVAFTYDGSLAAPVSTTDWGGTWEIECDGGTLRAARSGIDIMRADGTTFRVPCEEKYSDSRCAALEEFSSAITEGRAGETDIEDNYKSFIWMHAAVESVDQKRPVEINEFKK